jgi:hypothetical protein
MNQLKCLQGLGGDLSDGNIEVFEIGELRQGSQPRIGDPGHAEIDEAELGNLAQMPGTGVVHDGRIKADTMELRELFQVHEPVRGHLGAAQTEILEVLERQQFLNAPVGCLRAVQQQFGQTGQFCDLTEAGFGNLRPLDAEGIKPRETELRQFREAGVGDRRPTQP